MELFRQEYWSELPCPPPGDLCHPGIEPRSPALQADSLPSDTYIRKESSELRKGRCHRLHVRKNSFLLSLGFQDFAIKHSGASITSRLSCVPCLRHGSQDTGGQHARKQWLYKCCDQFSSSLYCFSMASMSGDSVLGTQHPMAYFFFNWSIFGLQYCVHFRFTTQKISYTYTYIHFCLGSSPIHGIIEY